MRMTGRTRSPPQRPEEVSVFRFRRNLAWRRRCGSAMKEDVHTINFSEVARQASCQLGTPYAFAVACGVVVLWALTGPLFGYSDTWQLVINTGTTIVTFLMVFLVQNTQNRDARALHLKLDEM